MSTTRFEIVLASSSDVEQQAASRLVTLLDRFSLDTFCYSSRIVLDATAHQSSAFPVPTLGADRLSLDGEELLTVLLHGQMHWALNQAEGGYAAVDEAKRRWLEDRDAGLDPPPIDALGQPCASGDYVVHVAVCAMEFAALSELLGRERASQLMSGMAGYGWIRDQLSDGTDGLEGYIARHGLGSAAQPPAVAARGLVTSIEPGGPRATLVTGDATERALAERLSELHGRFELRPWRFSPSVRLDASGPPSFDGDEPSISPFALRSPEDVLLLTYVQLQAMWQAEQLDANALEAAIAPVLAGTEVESGTTAAPPTSVIVGCAIALHALILLRGEAAAYTAGARHPRNSQLYAALAPHLVAIRSAIQDSGLE